MRFMVEVEMSKGWEIVYETTIYYKAIEELNRNMRESAMGNKELVRLTYIPKERK